MAKVNKKMATAALELPECPVCLEVMTAPIFNCQSGHSLCSTCTQSMVPAICPICRQNMTQMRNWTLEEIVSKAKVACPNKANGCVYTVMAPQVEDHLKECIFREMICPLEVFGRCSWKGAMKEIMSHFQERHRENCDINSDNDVVVEKLNLKEDDRRVYLTAQGKMLFVITMKIVTLQNLAYWVVQHIGSKKAAQQHIYEIHLTSGFDARRKVVFIDHCFNDALKSDEVFRTGKCAALPLDMLNTFVKDRKLSFRFFIKRIPVPNQNNNENRAPNQGKGPKGPGPKKNVPKGPQQPGQNPFIKKNPKN